MSEATASPSRPPRRRFAVAWLALLSLHLTCVGYYVGFAVAYRNLPKSNLAFRFRTYSIGIDESAYSKIATIHEAVAAIHALCCGLMLGGSLQRRRLAFYPCWRWAQAAAIAKSRFFKAHRRVVAVEKSSRTASLVVIAQYLSSTQDRVSTAIFSRHGLLGMDFVYFDHLLFARELLETSLQSYQAYRMSRLLSRHWLTRVYVALLVVNCWIMPVLHRVYATRDHSRRMWSVLGDVVLGTVSSIGISLFIFCIYAPQYSDPRFGFPSVNWFNDEWFVGVVQEFQLMVVVSWADMATRIAFALGLLQSVECLKDMLDRVLGHGSGIPAPATNTQLNRISPLELSDGHAVGSRTSKSSHNRPRSAMRFVLHVVGPVIFMLWGIIIGGVHIYSEMKRVDHPCRLPLRPWLSSKPACSLVEIDCHQIGVLGSEERLRESWTVFEPSLTAGLVVRHCPDLIIPASLHLFTGITSMKVYNATVVSWPGDSGLTAKAHGRLRAVHFVRTNFTGGLLPSGLQRTDFPATMGSIFMSATNLLTLPADLHTVWPARMTISIESAQFTAVPDVIMRLNPELVSLMGNPITSLPAELFEIPTLRNLFVSYTAIQELPRHVHHLGPSLFALFVEGTNISTFWSWVDPIVERSLPHRKFLFNAFDTPYCRERDEIVRGTRQRFSAVSANGSSDLAAIMDVSTPSRLAYVTTAVGCVFKFDTLFPLAVEDTSSAIR